VPSLCEWALHDTRVARASPLVVTMRQPSALAYLATLSDRSRRR
jgi:hypothetical protein